MSAFDDLSYRVSKRQREKRITINHSAAVWLLAWKEFADQAHTCMLYSAPRSARIAAGHARTCLQNFIHNYKPPINGKGVVK